eukprot:scaffold36532_cov35-Phaeocystis_antarctica.AAC.2
MRTGTTSSAVVAGVHSPLPASRNLNGRGMSDFGTGLTAAPYAATVSERRTRYPRVRRADQTRSLAAQAARAASCGATKAAL